MERSADLRPTGARPNEARPSASQEKACSRLVSQNGAKPTDGQRIKRVDIGYAHIGRISKLQKTGKDRPFYRAASFGTVDSENCTDELARLLG
jgi:hypothetical protein